MGCVRKIDNEGNTSEIVFESSDPTEVGNKATELSVAWRKSTKASEDTPAPYIIEGFDAVEIERGSPHEQRNDDGSININNNIPAQDNDRLVINEEKNTITVYGNADVPEDFDGTIINAP